MSVRLPPPGRMEDRVVVITGGSSGIGAAAARELALLGAEVAVVGRDPERTMSVAAEVGGRSYVADFDRLDDVRSIAARILTDLPRIHVLANNAGEIAQRLDTPDGYDQTFQRNHLAGFLLTNLLLDRLRETAAEAPGAVRVVQTSSTANFMGRVRLEDLDTRRGPWLGGWRAYGSAKLENILFTRELARRVSGIAAYAFHPGYVRTRFGSPLVQIAARTAGISAEEGAQPLVRLAAAPGVPAPSGNYFDRLTAPGRVNPQANDRDLARALWEASVLRAGL